MLSSCWTSKTVDYVYHPIVEKAKETSIYTNQVNWKEVNQKFLQLTDGKESIDEMKEGLQYLVNSLGDKHAQFRSPKDHTLIVSYTGSISNENKLERDVNYVNNVINNPSAKFSYRLLEDDIAYLNVVGIGPGDVKEQSDFIRKGILELKAKKANKWILDLRFNGGGNMEPMISGLAPLIGEGLIGGALNNKNEVSRVYKIEKGQFENYGRIACEMDESPIIAQSEKVVVLLSRYTISSGELLAVSFKGRANTRFIGEETAGYTTGNGYDIINDEIVMIISQDIFMDRNQKAYKKNVDVDDTIPFVPYLEMDKDLQIQAAKNWLIR